MAEVEDHWLSMTEICRLPRGQQRHRLHVVPAHRMGRLWKFKKDEVDEWVKAGGAADKSRQDQAE